MKPIQFLKNKIQSNIQHYSFAPYYRLLKKINAKEPFFQQQSDIALKAFSVNLQKKAQQGMPLNNLLVDAFALVREVCFRQLKMRPYDVQILTGLLLNDGKLAEMKTGEGKTIAALMPAFLNALTRKGVHILTFNDYLAQRDADWMRPVFEFLDLSVAAIQTTHNLKQKKKAYQADICYATAKNVGFDYLRSFIAYEVEDLVLRPFHYAIIDEADALLIDEARNPLVLAGNIFEKNIDFAAIADFVQLLRNEVDYEMDEYKRNIFLTDVGIHKTEKMLQIEDVHHLAHIDLLSAVNLAIQAKELLQKDRDYLIKDNQILLIDEFTGRIVADRKWKNGLQIAVEAKEKLPIQSEGQILGSISIPHLIRLYPKIAGMTATAVPAYEEFLNLYGLTVFKVPPHIPCKRLDHPNLIFTHQNAKMNALIKKIKAIHQTGRPILIGTLSIKESETLAQTLRQNGLDVQVLNAKNDALEAAIIAEAGALGAITISTNMAGRGTDIVLGGKDGRDRAQVKKLGGLFVIGTNLSESLRIDEQLRGRAGRQGDIGATQFFIAMDDELMLRYQFHSLLPDNYLMEQSVEAITDKLMMKRMNQAQRIIENQFFEMRKTLFEYANFIENQRFIFQEERQTILFKEKLPHISTDLRHFILNQYDQAWVEYLLFIEALRQGLPMLRLGGIGARNPLRTFYKDASKHFDLMREQLQTQIAALLAQKNLNAIDLTISKPASTWTYIISDSTYQDTLALSLCDSDNIGWQVDFITAPILLGLGLSKKMKK